MDAVKAVFAAILAFVRKEPVIVGNFVKALLVLLVAVGLPIDVDFFTKLIAIIAGVSGITAVERRSVWPDSKVQTLFKKD